MLNGKSMLSDELFHQVEETARAQNREPEELVADAVRKYLDEQSWLKYVERNEKRAQTIGIREEDVDRLIAETRRESVTNGR